MDGFLLLPSCPFIISDERIEERARWKKKEEPIHCRICKRRPASPINETPGTNRIFRYAPDGRDDWLVSPANATRVSLIGL